MARLAQVVVAEREALAFEKFKSGSYVQDVNALLLEKYGTKMAASRLYELRKAAHAEIFGNTPFNEDLRNEIDLLKKQNTSLASEVSFSQNKVRELEEQIKTTPSSNHNDLDDLALEMARSRELAIKNQELEDVIWELKGEITTLRSEEDKLKAKIEGLSKDLEEKDLEEKEDEDSDCYIEFVEGICDTKGIVCLELKEAIRSGNIFQAMKIAGISPNLLTT